MDAVPCATAENDENVDDLCFGYPKFLLTNNSVWDSNSYISAKNKYCKEIAPQSTRYTGGSDSNDCINESYAYSYNGGCQKPLSNSNFWITSGGCYVSSYCCPSCGYFWYEQVAFSTYYSSCGESGADVWYK